MRRRGRSGRLLMRSGHLLRRRLIGGSVDGAWRVRRARGHDLLSGRRGPERIKGQAVRGGTRWASAGDGRSTDVVERCRVRSCRRDRDSKSIRTSSRRARSTDLVPVVSSPASSSRPRISPTLSALRAFSVSGISIGSRSGQRGDVVARQTMNDRETLRQFQTSERHRSSTSTSFRS